MFVYLILVWKQTKYTYFCNFRIKAVNFIIQLCNMYSDVNQERNKASSTQRYTIYLIFIVLLFIFKTIDLNVSRLRLCPLFIKNYNITQVKCTSMYPKPHQCEESVMQGPTVLDYQVDYNFCEIAWSFSVGRKRCKEFIKKKLSHFYFVKNVVQFIQSLDRLVQANWLNLYETGLGTFFTI